MSLCSLDWRYDTFLWTKRCHGIVITKIRDADHIPKLLIKLFCTQARGIGELNAEGNNMRKISLFAGVAVLVLIGVGAWIGISTSSSTSALAASTIDPFAMMVGAKDLPISHYVDYSVVFN